ncbi:MAG: DUF4394 domain-containing protein, partial [Chloroflexota bacterium]|nr:DUF4394 domain-containing protein [Chloroflexota bacterium]
MLYAVDLATGEATEIGAVGGGADVIGLAAASDSDLIYGVTTDNRLVAITAATPGSLKLNLQISGLAPGVEIIGIDVRPATGELFGIGDDSIVYVLDVATGAATAVGTGIDPVIDGQVVGFDFNPTVDRIRLVTDTGQNLRLNPDTGAVGTNPETSAPTIDGPIAYAEGDDNAGTSARLAGAGYTNSVADAEETQLFVIDVANGVVALQDPPNDGVLNTVGDLGVELNDVLGFDITPDGDAYLVTN